ncbi:MAG TPA: ROK family protein [Dehalococcoidia bacterium]|nr:ROK family protein [Dehalococcoidia bacterium]
MRGEGLIGAIDLGGTKILSIVAGEDMRVVGRDQRPTGADDGPESVLERMVESLRAAAAGRPLRAIGVSTPGPCDVERGMVTNAPNLPGWREIPLARRMSEAFGLPAWIENDANAAAIAEHRLGSGRGKSHLVLVALGTGIGGGLIIDGRIYHGASGAAGEIGHMQLVPGGPPCGCGRYGCLEALASGSALARTAAALVDLFPHSVLGRISREEGTPPSALTLETAAARGDPHARHAIHQAGLYLGAGLTNLVDIFNPEVVAISGNLRKLDGYLSTAIDVVRREAFRQAARDARIVETELGDDAAALGAALVALDRLS